MSSATPSVPFNGTPEQKKQLEQVIAAHKGEKGALKMCIRDSGQHGPT